MSVKKGLYENLVLLVSLLIVSSIMVSVIGYFDEGNYRIYGSFSNYLFQGGCPPLSDYVVWYGISAVIGLAVFNILSALGEQTNSFVFRILTTLMTVPAVFLIVIFILIKSFT